MIPNEGEEGSDEDGSEEASYPLRCSFTITKVCDFRPFYAVVASSETYPQPSVPGAMSIDAVCQEGTFVIENVSFYKDSKLATDLTAESDWKRRGLYIGPQVCVSSLAPRHTTERCAELYFFFFHTSSRRSTSVFRRSLRGSSRSAVSMRTLHSSSRSTRSIKSKRYAQNPGFTFFPCADCNLGIRRVVGPSQELHRCLNGLRCTSLCHLTQNYINDRSTHDIMTRFSATPAQYICTSPPVPTPSPTRVDRSYFS